MLVMLQAPTPGAPPDRVTVGVAARLSRYLQVLSQAKKMGKDRISSQEIADYTNINATQIRRDLSNFGKFGKRGVGYSIESLLGDILATMIAAFPLMTKERERREEAERQRQIAEQRRQEEARQQKLNRDRYRRFLEHAGRWREAELARQFLAALRGALPEDAAEVAGNPVADWLAWIETSADLYDPLTGDPRDIFKSVAEVTSWTFRDG